MACAPFREVLIESLLRLKCWRAIFHLDDGQLVPICNASICHGQTGLEEDFSLAHLNVLDATPSDNFL